MLKKLTSEKVMNFTAAAVVALVLASGVLVGGRVVAPELFAEEQLRINDTLFGVEVADDPEERYLGLSDHTSLDERQGMWFEFDSPGVYGFVMRDMDFPIDIIWVDAERTIVGAAERAQPESYPGTVFNPPEPIQYVLELPAGSVERFAIEPGQLVEGPN